MDMPGATCSDCPFPLGVVFPLLALGLLLLGGATRLFCGRNRVAKAAAPLLLAVVVLLYFGLSVEFVRYGIDWRWHRHDLSFHTRRGSAPIVLAAWYVLSFLLARALYSNALISSHPTSRPGTTA